MKLSERIQAAQLRSEVPGAPLHIPPAPKQSPAAVMHTSAAQPAAQPAPMPGTALQIQPANATASTAPRPISGVSTYQTRAARRAAEAAAHAAAAPKPSVPSTPETPTAPAASALNAVAEHVPPAQPTPAILPQSRREAVQAAPVQLPTPA